MTKNDMISEIANRTGQTKILTRTIVESFFDVVKDTVANDEEVNIIGFGKFYAAERAGRTGRNPQTGEEMEIPASKSPRFKAGKILREAVKMA